jgi:hypothetical protein
MPTMRLLRLVCNNPEDSTGDDQVYLHVNGKRVWGPKRMNSSPADKRSKEINYSEDFGERIEMIVKLYEEDSSSPGRDDPLGEFTIRPTPTVPSRVHRFKGSEYGFAWEYELYWQVDG